MDILIKTSNEYGNIISITQTTVTLINYNTNNIDKYCKYFENSWDKKLRYLMI